ncbi:MAG TPA: ATP-binding protein [Stellaceae bacterium]|nr:ATP-binding protein [Stellaceae bacterium]
MQPDQPIRILLVEDNPADARLTRALLAEAGKIAFELVDVARLADGMARLAEERFDIALVDLSLPDASGLDTVTRLRHSHPNIPLIVLSGLADEQAAIDALHGGAQDYLVKGQGDGHLISRAIRYAIERRRTEAQLIEAKEKAEAANRAKTEFLANMSHELRTPLNAVIGFSEILQMQTMGPLGHPAYVDYVRDIHVSGVHLLAIINDILDLSKIEIGHREVKAINLNLDTVLRYCARLVGERAATAGLTLVIETPPEPPQLQADEQMVKQMLLNLLSNAIKFTPKGGRVSAIAGLDEAGAAFIRVADTGIGMAPADVARALQPFVQIDNALSRKFAGTGLGLPLVKSMIELHGGHIAIDSAEQVGTAVTLHFAPERTLRGVVRLDPKIDAAEEAAGRPQKVPG